MKSAVFKMKIKKPSKWNSVQKSISVVVIRSMVSLNSASEETSAAELISDRIVRELLYLYNIWKENLPAYVK